MGWFGFSGYKPHEQQLLDIYTQMLAVLSGSSAEGRRMARGMLDDAIADGKRFGTYSLPRNCGDLIVDTTSVPLDDATRRVCEAVRKSLPQKRSEGVTDADIRLWWNFYDVERRIAVKVDEVQRQATLLNLLTQMDATKAGRKLWQIFPRYGNPKEGQEQNDAEKPLPYELKDRINRYTERRTSSDLHKWKAELECAISMNALIRERIREKAL
jgi:hypothetical protein